MAQLGAAVEGRREPLSWDLLARTDRIPSAGQMLRAARSTLQPLAGAAVAQTHLDKLVHAHSARCRILVLEDKEGHTSDAILLRLLVTLLDLEVVLGAVEPVDRLLLRVEQAVLDGDTREGLLVAAVDALDVMHVVKVHREGDLLLGLLVRAQRREAVGQVRAAHVAVGLEVDADRLKLVHERGVDGVPPRLAELALAKVLSLDRRLGDEPVQLERVHVDLDAERRVLLPVLVDRELELLHAEQAEGAQNVRLGESARGAHD